MADSHFFMLNGLFVKKFLQPFLLFLQKIKKI
jgi:hypothetical protein